MTKTASILLALFALLPESAWSHSLNDSFIELNLVDRAISGSVQLAIKDLEIAVGLDANADSEVHWGEVIGASKRIEQYVANRLRVSTDAEPCHIDTTDYRIRPMTSGAYLVLGLSGFCPNTPTTLDIYFAPMFDMDSSHRGIANISWQNLTLSHVFSPGNDSLELEQSSPVRLRVLLSYINEGIWHIWIGIDHILFLLAMMLGVFVYQRKQNKGELSTRACALEIIRLVTAFTIAHSITLVAATMGLVSLPAALVESAIALTVVIGGANVLYPIFGNRHWQFALGFGLIHGFGFANVLAELSLSKGLFFTSLFGFNLGVELGQLAIVVALTPLLILATHGEKLSKYATTLSGLLLCQFGLFWLVERSL